jgi:hypothetical protein
MQEIHESKIYTQNIKPKIHNMRHNLGLRYKTLGTT